MRAVAAAGVLAAGRTFPFPDGPVAALVRPMRILSGLQPTGRLHLGNFFGMMEPAIRLQDEGEAFYFIADYHSLTSVKDPAALRENPSLRQPLADALRVARECRPR